MAVLDAAVVLIWIAWVIRTFSVEIDEEKITGPNEKRKRISILRRKLDVWKTENLRTATKPKGYFDLWAFDGSRIRIVRNIMGRRNVFFIARLLLGELFQTDQRSYHNPKIK